MKQLRITVFPSFVVLLVFFVTLIVCDTVLAAERTLRVGFPRNLPPWTLQSEMSGITIEIVQGVMRYHGYSVSPVFLSLTELNEGIAPQLDAHAQVESRNLEGYYSKKILDFETSLVSLRYNQFDIDRMRHLGDKRIAAFQNASFLFGPEFREMSRSNPDYMELEDQEQQVVLLYNGRVDVILIDKRIFLYFRRITSRTNTSMPVRFHEVPGLTIVSPAFVVFRSREMRDLFDEGLESMMNENLYYDIFYKYVR